MEKKFIFAGDFNSHIMLKGKDEKVSMFDTLNKFLDEGKIIRIDVDKR